MRNRSLNYNIPKMSRPKTQLRIPEAHNLHITPLGCGRCDALRSVKNGSKDHESFLNISLTDLVSGGWERKLADSIGTLLRVLSPAPKAFCLYFTCVSDITGMDDESLLTLLREEYPGIRFAIFHHTAIDQDRKIKPGMRMLAGIYALLERSVPDSGINFIGNYVSPSDDCEIWNILSCCSVTEVREIIHCDTFEKYLRMGQSRLNVVLMDMGLYTAQQLEAKFGIPYLYLPASYRISKIKRDCLLLARTLCGTDELPGGLVSMLQGLHEKAEEKISNTVKAVGNRSVLLDSSCSMTPYSLALALCEYGFNVSGVLVRSEKAETDSDELTERFPNVRHIVREASKDILGYGFSGDELCLGYDAAVLTGTDRYVDMWHDEGYYGYQGVMKLMDQIYETAFPDENLSENREDLL